MRNVFLPPKARRWRHDAALAAVLACLILFLSTASAGARPAPDPGPGPTPPTAASSTPTDPADPDSTLPPPTGEESVEDLSEPIDPGLLESLQQSVVGLVTVWEEPEDPWAMFRPEPPAQRRPKAVNLCTGWFDTPTTIVTAGHCVDPAEGRLLLDGQKVTIDPLTGDIVAPPPGQPEPKRTVYAFQPRELPGAIIPAPTIVRVDAFRRGADGDTAKLEIHGLPPGRPIPIAHTTPRLGHAVTAIGFPGLNIESADGVDIDALINDDKNPAEVLQESRIQPVSTSGTIISRQFRGGVPVYQTNADLAFGISGGPTVNSRGEVYGVNSQMTLALFAGGNFNIITDTGMLRDFLDHDQPATPGAQPSTPAEPSTTTTTPAAAPPPAAASPAATEERSSPRAADTAGIAAAVSGIGGAIVGAGAVLLIRRRAREDRSGPDSEKRETKRESPRHRAPRRAHTNPDNE